MEFIIKESEILKGVFIIKPDKFSDFRGDIFSVWKENAFDFLLPKGLKFVLDKFTISKQNVLRGIHGDEKSYKLVSCVYGEILQVVVDCRKESPNYLKHEKFTINHENPTLILIPPRFGNAQYIKSAEAVYFYKWAFEGEYVDADAQFTYLWDDKRIGIEWGEISPILSERDKNEHNIN